MGMATGLLLECRQGMSQADSELLYGGGISDWCWKEVPFPDDPWEEGVLVDGQHGSWLVKSVLTYGAFVTWANYIIVLLHQSVLYFE